MNFINSIKKAVADFMKAGFINSTKNMLVSCIKVSFVNSIRGKTIIGLILAVITMLVIDVRLYTIIVWVHVLAGVLWIGLLYYFNFVQIPAVGATLADPKGPSPAIIGKYIAPRALFLFRMSAAVTWIMGLYLLVLLNNSMAGVHLAFTFARGYEVIGFGAWMGTIMAFNVWFIIWPNQKRILGIVSATEGEIAKAKKYASLASSINVILSVPMLLTMLAYRF